MQQQWLEEASKATEANIAAIMKLSEKSAQNLQSLFEKQSTSLQTCMESSQEKMQKLAAAKDFSEYVTLQSDMMVECGEKMLASYNDMIELAGTTQTELNAMVESTVAGEEKAAAPAKAEAAPAPAKKKPAAKKTTKTA